MTSSVRSAVSDLTRRLRPGHGGAAAMWSRGGTGWVTIASFGKQDRKPPEIRADSHCPSCSFTTCPTYDCNYCEDDYFQCCGSTCQRGCQCGP
jgi:hypothetical protein